MNLKEILLSFIFPRRCVSCGRVGKYICSRCIPIIRIIEQNQLVCPVCERPAVGGATHPKCQTPYGLDGLTSFYVYDGPIKKAIKELKYRFVSDLAGELISLSFGGLTSAEVKPLRKTKFAILTSVPLHWRRENWRGFNQAEILGRLISARLGIRFLPDLLVRKKFTKPQVELEGKKRKENIEGAFVINPRISRSILVSQYHNIILFDDVWTTGSTLKTCGKVLKEAGAGRVWGLTLAR